MKNFINTTSFYALACLSPHFKTNIESLSFLHKFSETYFYLRKPNTSTSSKTGIAALWKDSCLPYEHLFPMAAGD